MPIIRTQFDFTSLLRPPAVKAVTDADADADEMLKPEQLQTDREVEPDRS